MKMKLGAALAAVVTWGAIATAHGDVTLVKDGAPVAPIVVGEKPTRAAQFAAYELQHVVELITGAKLEIVSGDAARGRAAVRGSIYVGCAGGVTGTTGSGGFANAKDFVREEYLVEMRDGNIILAGNDDPDYGKVDYRDEKTFPKLKYAYRSTEYAVYDFLEKSCGVRFYDFGDVGTAFEPRKTLVVKDFATKRRAPKMGGFRDLYWGDKPTRFMGQTQRDADLLQHRWRVNVMYGQVNHSVMGIYARYWKPAKWPHVAKLFIERRPDYFAQGYEGKNCKPSVWGCWPDDPDIPPGICTSSDGAVAYFADEAKRLARGENVEFCYASRPVMRDQPFFYPFEEDDTFTLCQCEKCRPSAKFPEYRFRHFDFASRLAAKIHETNPKVQVATLAYEDHLRWSPDYNLAPGILVQMCLSAAYWNNPNVYRYQHDEIYKTWVKKEGKRRPLALWNYLLCPWHEVFYIHHYGKYFPVVYPRHTGRYYREFAEDGIVGVFTEFAPMQSMLEGYVALKMCDDPTQDPDQIVDEHFKFYYGAAADAMKAFADGLESYSFDIANYSKRAQSYNPSGSFLYRMHEEQDNWYLGSTNAIARFSALMAAAKAAAKTPLEKRRVDTYDERVWRDVPAGRAEYEERQRRRSVPVPWIVAPHAGDWGGDVAKVTFTPQSTSVPFVTLDNGKADTDARFSLAADTTHFYLRYTEKGGAAKAHIKDSIWGNGIEIHVCGAKKSDFLQVAIAPSGEVKANVTVVENGGSRVTELAEPPKAKSVATDAGWTAEIAIPYSLLPGGMPAPHFDRTRANVFRTRLWKGGVSLAWSPIFNGSYLGNEDRRGEFVFVALPKLSNTIRQVSASATSDIRITHSAARRGRLSVGQPPHDEIVNYGLISFLQLSPDRAVALVNRNVWPKNNNWDCEDGSDLFVVGALDEIKTAQPIPVGRSGVFADPARNGAKRWHNRYPFQGGFVPLGAKLDGKPHPHAGTGFLIGTTLTYPLKADGTFHQSSGDISWQNEFYDLSYDGAKLVATPVARYYDGQPLKIGTTGWEMSAHGFSHAIPDGADLLATCKAQRIGSPKRSAVGVCRWSRLGGRWQPVAFTAVAEGEGFAAQYEPTLVRDARGYLLFSARDEARVQEKNPKQQAELQDLRAWLSIDGGRTWGKILDLPEFRSWAPLAVGATPDGKTFIATSPVIDGKGWYGSRIRLSLWPFDNAYRSLGREIPIRDTKKELPAAGRQLLADHPSFAQLRLKDGKWHAVVSYRVRLQYQTANGKPLEPGPDDGAYAEEITTDGTPLPVWEF